VVNDSRDARRELKILGKMKSIHETSGCPVLGGKQLHITVNPNDSNVLVIDTPFFKGNTLSEAVKTEDFAIHVPWVILELLFTVAYINDNEYMHGDIKPGNILVSDDGQVKLIDFGFTCELSQARFVQGDFIIVNFGTPKYLSLEILQALRRGGRIPTGGDPLEAMKKIDSYALAITMFNLLSRAPHLPGSVKTLGDIAPAFLKGAEKNPHSSVFDLLKGGLTGVLQITPGETLGSYAKSPHIPMGDSCDIITILNGMGCIDPTHRKSASSYASQLRIDCIADATLYAQTYKEEHGEESTHPIDERRWEFQRGNVTIDNIPLVARYLGISIVNGVQGTYTGAAGVVELPEGGEEWGALEAVLEVPEEEVSEEEVSVEEVSVDGESGSMTDTVHWKSKSDDIPNQPHLDLGVKQGGDPPILSPEEDAMMAALETMDEQLAETDKHEVTRIILRMSKDARALIKGLSSELNNMRPDTRTNEAILQLISRTCAEALHLDDGKGGLGTDVSYADFMKCAQYQKNTIGHGPTGPPPIA